MAPAKRVVLPPDIVADLFGFVVFSLLTVITIILFLRNL